MRRADGFTLLEVAVALAILGIGVVTVLQIFQGALRLQVRASERTSAILAARGTLDEILTARLEDNLEFCRSSTRRRDGVTCEITLVQPEDLGMTKEQWEALELPDPDQGLEEVANGEDHVLLKVNVTVSWGDGGPGHAFTGRTFRYYNAPLWLEAEGE